jgi:Flp pilus assembly pilin Flp
MEEIRFWIHWLKVRIATGRHDERGFTAVEWLLIALGVITIAGIAVASIKAYVESRQLTGAPTMLRPANRDQRGAMAIEFMLVMSMLILVFLVMLQYALQVHAEQIAHAAADQALAAATAYDGSPADGHAAGSSYLADSGNTLGHPSISVTRNADYASVTVTGHVTPFIPFLPVSVTVHVEGPVEKFVAAP